MEYHPNVQGETIPIANLAEKVIKSGEPMTVPLPDTRVVMLLIPKTDYNHVISVLKLKHSLPTQPSKTPHQLFVETARRLQELERKYETSSQEFYERFQRGDIQEGPLDYFDWRIEYGAYLTLKERFGFSRSEEQGV